MMNDPSHKAMLYFLEVLMNSDSPQTIAQLAARFTQKAFTPDMREACGNSEAGLRRFLQRYPSLFRVNGNQVTAVPIDMPSLPESVTSAVPSPPPSNGLASDTCSVTSTTSSMHDRGGSNNNNNNNNYLHISNGNSASTGVTFRRESSYNDSASSTSLGSTRPVSCYGNGMSFDFGMETEAVKFFQARMSKREERWVPIKSLAGHLSQASADVRQVVGPQSEFRRFLLKHPHVFEVQGELVGLKDTFSVTCMSKRTRPSTISGINGLTLPPTTQQPLPIERGNGRAMRPKSLIMPPTLPSHTAHVVGGSHSRRDGGGATSAPSTPVGPGHPPNFSGHRSSLFGLPNTPAIGNNSNAAVPVTMTTHEYKAVMFIRRVLHKKGGAATFETLMTHMTQAPETVRNTIGWMRVELEEFVRKRGAFFDVSAGQGSDVTVRSRRGAKLNILITSGGSRHDTDSAVSARALTNRCGRIFYVAKLWGIIDLGHHEHVFFDRSIFRHLDDLQKHFKVDEMLYFNAILAPKESRAKWRATQVWKESDRAMVEKFSGPALAPPGSSGFTRSDSHNSQFSSGSGGTYGGQGSSGRHGSAITPQMDLTDEVKFLSEEIEDELDRVLKLKRGRDAQEHGDDLYADDEEELDELDSLCSLPTNSDTSPDISMHSEPLPNRGAGTPLTSQQPTTSAACQTATKPSHRRVGSHSSKSASSVNKRQQCIATPAGIDCSTQTLSTGDIMATQIFHDSMSKLV